MSEKTTDSALKANAALDLDFDFDFAACHNYPYFC
jgi:hypothetical protein